MRTVIEMGAYISKKYMKRTEAEHKANMMDALIRLQREQEASENQITRTLLHSQKMLIIDAIRREWNFA